MPPQATLQRHNHDPYPEEPIEQKWKHTCKHAIGSLFPLMLRWDGSSGGPEWYVSPVSTPTHVMM